MRACPHGFAWQIAHQCGQCYADPKSRRDAAARAQAAARRLLDDATSALALLDGKAKCERSGCTTTFVPERRGSQIKRFCGRTCQEYRPDRREHYLYRYWGHDGALVYVGITTAADPGSRHNDHSRTQPWAVHTAHRTLEVHPTRYSAKKAEALAIRDEGPIFNKQRPNPDRIRETAE
jgi:hypothetical protein